jgi:hypothetical protein
MTSPRTLLRRSYRHAWTWLTIYLVFAYVSLVCFGGSLSY